MDLPEGFTGVMVATPAYGGLVTNAFFQSTMQLALAARNDGLPVEVVSSPGDSLVTRARNTLTAVFLASRHSHLLFVDADIEFHPRDVLRLLVADKDLVCGIYPKKSVAVEFPLNWLPGSHQQLNRCQTSGAIEILEGPTGFMLIHRRVFDAMLQAWPGLRYRGPSFLSAEQQRWNAAFFDAELHPGEYAEDGTAIRDGHYLSEDFAFCRRWRELGGQVWAIPEIELRHHGMHAFTGSLTTCLSTEPAPVAAPPVEELAAA